MNAYRWFRVGHADGLVSLTDFLRVCDEPSESQWFEVLPSIGGVIKGRFVQRSSVYLEQMDDFGEIAPSAMTIVRAIFVVAIPCDKFIIVRVEDNHRMVSSFVSFVAMRLGFGLYVEPIDVRPILDELMGGGGRLLTSIDSLKLVAIKVTGADPGRGISSRVEISSRHGFIVSEVSSMLPSGYILNSAKFEMTKVGVPGGLSINAQGRCCLTGKLSGFILNEIEMIIIGL